MPISSINGYSGVYSMMQKKSAATTMPSILSATDATPVSTAASAPADGLSLTSAAKTPEQQFMDFMKETPQQRYEDMWLQAHHLTREQLAAMPPDKQKEIRDEMKKDVEQKIKEAINKKQPQLDITA